MTPLLILIPALFSSCGTRGNVKAGGGYDNGGINGGVAVEVGWGNPAPAPIPRTIYPDPAMVGLCYREDTINEDGTITPAGDPIVITGAPFTLPPTTGRNIGHFFVWGEELMPFDLSGSGASQSSSNPKLAYVGSPFPKTPVRTISLPGIPSITGDYNATFKLRHEVEDFTPDSPIPGNRGRAIFERVEDILNGVIPEALPSWADFVSFQAWRLTNSQANVEMIFGVPGSDVTEFELELNGLPGQLTLNDSSVTESVLGQWVMVTVNIPVSFFSVPSAIGELTENRVDVTWTTDLQGETSEWHVLDMIVTSAE